MDLGIAGRKAIVCASSRGLGRGCALALAEAGVHLTINGRNEQALEATAAEIKRISGLTPHVVLADVSTKAGQDALLEACPDPDILVNNNGGPPPKGFREIDRQAMLEGVVQNMVTPIELTQPGDFVVCLGAGNITAWANSLPADLDALRGGKA